MGLSVRYYLDGKSVSPEELKGKSGKVTIRFDYENRQYETVQINGVNQRIYVPFAMLTGMILDTTPSKMCRSPTASWLMTVTAPWWWVWPSRGCRRT